MSEWWTYTLSDFLLFSPRTYYRLIERYNESAWPGHLVTLALGLGLAGLVRRPGPWQGRVASGILAVLWIWVAWAFFWRRYATINWAATYLGWAFAAQALLLAWAGLVSRRLRFRAGRDLGGIVGAALLVLGVAAYPAIAPLAGRAARQGEVFGIAPDPTAIATLGVLLLAEAGPRRLLAVVPILGCLLSGATLWALGSPDAWVPGLAALLAALACGRPRTLLSSQDAVEGVPAPETSHPPP